jgi:hypothetical protein
VLGFVTLGFALFVAVVVYRANADSAYETERVTAPPEVSAPLFDDIGPWWVPTGILLLAAWALVSPASRKHAHCFGYLALFASLTLGGVLYFLNGRLGELSIGPIPRGTPINLLANLNPDADRGEMKQALKTTLDALTEIKTEQLDEAEAQRILRERVAPELMKVNKCPDLVMDRGHYFEWFRNMTDDDKEALIELLKTF